MNVAGYLLVFIVRSATFSVLTDDNVHNSTKQDLVGVDGQNVDVFRQLLNQETIIRMNLVKNVHALMKDMLILKENLAVAERKIYVLTMEVQELQLENRVLKNESEVQSRRLAEMERNLTQISEDHKAYQRNSDFDRKAFELNVSGILADIKIEVRYLSITLLDLNTHTRQIENDIPNIIDLKNLAMFASINSSLDDFNATLMATDSKIATRVSDLEKSHGGVLSSVSDYVNTTVDSLKAELKDSRIEQLKLSSTVTSLEMFRMNLTKSNCDPKKKVAFTAGVTSSSSTWNSGTLVFPVVITNIGGGYNPITGIFTAPTDGHYVFFVTVVEYESQDIRVDIVLNGSRKVRAIANSSTSYQSASNMAVLMLQKGDTVWIGHNNGKGYNTHSTPLTTFSGFLL